MSQPKDSANPLDPFGLMRTMRDANMDTWSTFMQQFVNSDEYAQASGAMMDTYFTTSEPLRRALAQVMTQVLAQLNMPTREDVISLAERLTNIEMRLDDLDARLVSMQDSHQA